MSSEIEVAFLLTGIGFDPDKITTLAGIKPTNTWRYGDNIQNTLIKRKHDGWCISTKRQISEDLNIQLREILDQIKPHILKIKEVAKEYKLEAEISCAVYFDGNDRPAIYFERDTIEILSTLNAEIDIDIYSI